MNDKTQAVLDALRILGNTNLGADQIYYSHTFSDAIDFLYRNNVTPESNPGLYWAIAYGMLYGQEKGFLLNPRDENQRLH